MGGNDRFSRFMEGAGRLLPLVVFVGLAAVLLWPALPARGAGISLAQILKLALVIGIAAAASAVIRWLVAPLVTQEAVAGRDGLRDRIAPLVLVIGSAAILALAAGVLFLFRAGYGIHPDGPDEKYDALVMGIFTAVLPVFATWVGTVLAFYFTNESYREAARASRPVAETPEKIGESALMQPYEKITAIKLEANGKDALDEARKIELSKARDLFNDTISRIFLFDKERRLVAIVRQRLVPAMLTTDARKAGATIGEYLASIDENAEAEARRYFDKDTPVTYLQEVARNRGAAVSDFFITQNGRKDGAVLGWVDADRLRSRR